MTRIVYAAPDISPEVWTPPRGVTVLPLSEHPAIIWESLIERMPGEPPREHKKRPLAERTQAVVEYLRTHPPADANTIAVNLGLRWGIVKSLLLHNPQLFRRAGTVQVGKVNRGLWALVER